MKPKNLPSTSFLIVPVIVFMLVYVVIKLNLYEKLDYFSQNYSF